MRQFAQLSKYCKKRLLGQVNPSDCLAQLKTLFVFVTLSEAQQMRCGHWCSYSTNIINTGINCHWVSSVGPASVRRFLGEEGYSPHNWDYMGMCCPRVWFSGQFGLKCSAHFAWLVWNGYWYTFFQKETKQIMCVQTLQIDCRDITSSSGSNYLFRARLFKAQSVLMSWVNS